MLLPAIDETVYLSLFLKMTPQEVIGWLNGIFWRSEYKISIEDNPKPAVVRALHIDSFHRIKESRLNGVIAVVDIGKHVIYHKLFRNMTPSEIVDWLNKKYWGNKYEINIRERKFK